MSIFRRDLLLMTTFIKLLQNPLVKIFLAPFALIGVGTIVGLSSAASPNWINALLLFVIVVSSQLIDHYFHQRNVQRNHKSTPEFILYVCEGILIITSVIFILRNNWIINLLLLLYIAYIHFQYIPFPIVNTFYQYILTIFFNAFILNTVAYYSQTTSITTNFLLLLIPLALITAGITIEINHLRYLLITRKKQSTLYHWTGIGLAIVAIFAGVYFTLPSQSYFLAQIAYVFITLFSIIPAIVQVDNEKQRQNKINYLSTALLIFSIFYSLAIVF